MTRRALLTTTIVILAIVAAFAYWNWSGQSLSSTQVRLGVLFPLTGDAAAYGAKGRNGIQLAVDDFNRSRQCKRSLGVIFEDSAAQPETGLSGFDKLSSADHVPAVIGDIVSAVTLAVAPAANRSKTILLSPTASAPAITQAGPYVYRIWPSDLEEGRAIAQYAIGKGFKRAAVLYMNNDYGVAIQAIFTRVFNIEGRQVVASQSYMPTDQDFRSALTRVAGENVDVLYVAGYYADSATIVRQARTLGMHMPILGTTAIEDPQFLKLAGLDAEGIVYPLATGFDASSTDPQVVKFVDEFKTRFGQTPGWVEAQAYDAVAVLCQAMSGEKGTVTGQGLKDELDQFAPMAGVTGTIKFDSNGDVVKPVRLRIVKGGKFTNLEP